MNGIVFTSQADATAFSAGLDVRVGYPRDGVNVGGGRHVPRAAGRTLRHGDVIKHPTQNRWRYPHDAVVQLEIGRGHNIPPTGAVQALGPDWFPA